ncbi:Transposon Tf2-9 polyprotein [Linum perenne]
MAPPKTVKEVQVLAGRITAINRFIPKAAERYAPFFSILKNASKFAWNEKCDKAFEELKQFLVTPPVLASPKEGDELSPCRDLSFLSWTTRGDSGSGS